MSATTSLGPVDFKDRTAVFHLRRGVEGAVTTLQWSRPDGSELDIKHYQLHSGPDGVRGMFQLFAGGGHPPCTWEGRPLLLFPANPKPGLVINESAVCHDRERGVRHDYQQELRVIEATTAVVDGATLPAWKMRRIRHEKASGSQNGEGTDDGEEVWLAQEPLLVRAVGTNKGRTRRGTTAEQHREFWLERTLPPS